MMLINDVKTVEDSKLMVGWVHELVWLNLVERPLHGARKARVDIDVNLSVAIGSGGHFKDWECRLVAWCPTAGNDQLPHQVIERHAEIMYGITEDGAEVWRNSRNLGNPKDVLGSLFVIFADHRAPACREQRPGTCVKVGQMLLRSLDPHENACKIRRARGWGHGHRSNCRIVPASEASRFLAGRAELGHYACRVKARMTGCHRTAACCRYSGTRSSSQATAVVSQSWMPGAFTSEGQPGDTYQDASRFTMPQ